MSETLPFMLGRYRLTEKIGSGAMGVVYKGLDPLIGRPVAVKVIRTDLLDESEREGYLARFRQEVRSAGRCIHPGIVTVFDYAEKNGSPYIVMEYVEGPILQLLLGKGRLPVEQSISITLQLLAALGHAHGQGIVHRDIKPANVIVGPNLQVKIADFGIARMDANGLTNAGTLLGTPNYMSPEQARGERADHRADLFAVGVVFLHMLTGSLPYGADSFVAVLHKMAAANPIDVSSLDAIEPRLAAVASLALAKNPAERFQSAQEFEHLLRSLSVDHSEAEIWPGMAANVDVDTDLPADARAVPPVRQAATEALQQESAIPLPGGGDVTAPAAWPDDLLERLRACLANGVGPIAGLLVTQTAPDCATLEELVQRLGLLIQNEAVRARFSIAARNAIAGFTAPALPIPEPPATATAIKRGDGPSPETLIVSIDIMSSAQALLARFIGPIARVLVRQSSLDVRSLEEFGERLASHIDQADERDRFRHDLAALIERKERERVD
jgi:eukaryotic-like serine/threonine-protein kinase